MHLRYRKYLLLLALPSLLLLSACGSSLSDWLGVPLIDDGDGGNDTNISDSEVIQATSTYSVPLGGTASGNDELVIHDASGNVVDFTGHTLEFQTNNSNVELRIRTGFSDFMTGSGALIIPKAVGSTIISYKVDGIEQADKYKVIIPPQSLIQILLGEARGQIESETIVANGRVKLDSASPTGNAIAAVVRNRVLLLEAGYTLSLFVVDTTDWGKNPPSSHWDAVITANNGAIYQFSPVDPSDLSNEVFLSAENRINLTENSLIKAYDQATLTAAGIFINDTVDPTGGSFAFRTPTQAESDCLVQALNENATTLPADCGPGDDNFPTFAPVQVLIHPSVAKLSDGRPSFVFIRNRDPSEPAVTNAP